MSEKTIEKEAEETVQEIMYGIVSLLNSYGITDVRAGAVMRLLGTAEEEAKIFDDKVLFIDGDFIDMRELDEIPGEYVETDDVDPDRTLH